MGRARGPLEAGLGAHVKWLECTHVRVTREHSRRTLGSEHSQSLAPRNLGLIKNVFKIHPDQIQNLSHLRLCVSVSAVSLCHAPLSAAVHLEKENGFIFLYFLSNH